MLLKNVNIFFSNLVINKRIDFEFTLPCVASLIFCYFDCLLLILVLSVDHKDFK